jgi:hypothetical protein
MQALYVIAAIVAVSLMLARLVRRPRKPPGGE